MGTTTLSKNSSEVSCACMPDLVEVAAALEARHAALDDQQADALVAEPAVGLVSVRATTITRSAIAPLLMNVLEPLST